MLILEIAAGILLAAAVIALSQDEFFHQVFGRLLCIGVLIVGFMMLENAATSRDFQDFVGKITLVGIAVAPFFLLLLFIDLGKKWAQLVGALLLIGTFMAGVLIVIANLYEAIITNGDVGDAVGDVVFIGVPCILGIYMTIRFCVNSLKSPISGAEKMRCAHCGHKSAVGATFCSRCGTRIMRPPAPMSISQKRSQPNRGRLRAGSGDANGR